VGGIKEKVLAAHRAGLTRVILPRRNEKDLYEVPADVQVKQYTVIPVLIIVSNELKLMGMRWSAENLPVVHTYLLSFFTIGILHTVKSSFTRSR